MSKKIFVNLCNNINGDNLKKIREPLAYLQKELSIQENRTEFASGISLGASNDYIHGDDIERYFMKLIKLAMFLDREKRIDDLKLILLNMLDFLLVVINSSLNSDVPHGNKMGKYDHKMFVLCLSGCTSSIVSLMKLNNVYNWRIEFENSIKEADHETSVLFRKIKNESPAKVILICKKYLSNIDNKLKKIKIIIKKD